MLYKTRCREMDKEKSDIAQIIAAFLSGQITDEQLLKLEVWKKESESNRQIFERVTITENIRKDYDHFHSFDKREGWDKVSGRVKVAPSRDVLLVRSLLNYAAMVLLIVGSAFWLLKDRQTIPAEVQKIAEIQDTLDKNKIQLKLEDGTIIDLQGGEGKQEIYGRNFVADNKSHVLSYHADSSRIVRQLVYNEIYVPKGGEYRLVLSDSTVIYLNSMTSVRYPVVFGNNERVIELRGQAYLEVAKDTLRPFIVKTSAYDVRVLGTKFDISAYDDDNKVLTTLVEGLVKIAGDENSIEETLKPGEQLLFDKKDKITVVSQVDVSYCIAWKEGKFRFRDIPLEELMKIAARWYDIEVIYLEPEVKNYLFGCNFGRHETIDPLLRIFERNGKVNVKRDGKVLQFSRGR